jgi:hypothetical protein
VSFFLLNLLNLLNKFNKINRKNDTLNRPASESYLQSTLVTTKKATPLTSIQILILNNKNNNRAKARRG